MNRSSHLSWKAADSKTAAERHSAAVPLQRWNLRAVWCLASLVLLCARLRDSFEQPAFSGKVSGGFQAPTSTDTEGRRHVVRGKDMESRGNNLLELTEPRVTRYNPDDTPDMFIESARCFYNTK